MHLTTVQINILLEDYLRELVALLPQSSSALLDAEVGARPHVDDSRLIKLLDLARHGDLLRHCTDLEARALIMA